MLYGDLFLMLPGPRRTHSCDVGRKAAAKAHFGGSSDLAGQRASRG